MSLTAQPAAARGDRLAPLLRPSSIAVLGASANTAKLSGRILTYLQHHGFPGVIWPVNPAREVIGDLPCFADVAALPNAPDLAIVALPPDLCVQAVEALALRGTKACAVLSSGFGEISAAGAALEARLAAIAAVHGTVILGPNCLGFLNAFDSTVATFSQYAAGEVVPGPVAFVSQSGAFGTAVAGLARQKGLGLGWFVNTGNEAALDVWDVLDAAVDDARIKVLAAYVENLGDGRKMVQLARRAAAADKPLVLAKVGNSDKGARAAAAHTGALATPARMFEGVARQHGVLNVSDEREMLNVIEALLRAGPVGGRRIGVVTMSGGAGVQMADLAEGLGAPLPDLSDKTRAALKPQVPEFAGLTNPVDVTAQLIAKPEILQNAVATLQADPEIDCVIVWLQMMDGFGPRIAEGLAKCKACSSVPLLVSWVAAAPDTRAALLDHDIATFESGADALRAAVALAKRSEAVALLADAPAAAAPPAPAGAVVLTGPQAAARLEGCGVPLARSQIVNSANAAAAAVSDGGQFAFKVVSPDIAHKSDVGGVQLGVTGDTAARGAFEAVMANARAAIPAARIEGVEVQPMAAEGVELVSGFSQQPAFGPVVMLGYGGIFVEIVGGAQFAMAPVSPAQARAMIDALPAQQMLDGARGLPKVDRTALADAFARFSSHMARHADQLSEVDLNPVIATQDGLIAVDWLVNATCP